MSDVIIDTNVAVVANHQNPGVTPACTDACVSFVASVRDQHVVLLDAGDEIRAEYAKALKVQPPYGIGALLLIHIFQQQYNEKYVKIVELEQNDAGEFADFPLVVTLAGFDVDDRKFAALSKKTGVPVTTATDSDWADHAAALAANGISINFLCGPLTGAWFA